MIGTYAYIIFLIILLVAVYTYLVYSGNGGKK
jgi:hypothetical protein